MSAGAQTDGQQTLFGHPTGLFNLFFAEMWERFSYYGMRALLIYYMTKDFLRYSDEDAYKVYGAYTSLVYMTPFLGGMLADKILGPRNAVVLGGLLMAAGHFLMEFPNEYAFFAALGLLVAGNGMFKPNISTMVGSLYEAGSPKRDGGFTLFYMGINLGAAMAPLLCGYVGETYGWHYGFGLATIGMLVGLAVFVAPTVVTQALILGAALPTAASMFWLSDNAVLQVVNGVVAVALMVSAFVSTAALQKGGLPQGIGAAPGAVTVGGMRADLLVGIGSFVAVPLFAVVIAATRTMRIVPESMLEPITASGSAIVRVGGVFLNEIATPAGLVLFIAGVLSFGYLFREAFRSVKIERERLIVAITLMFFSVVFWAFFEQAGSSLALFTDRNVDRVSEDRVVAASDVGQTLTFELNQAQVGYTFSGDVLVNGEPVGFAWVDDPDTEDQPGKESDDDVLTVTRSAVWTPASFSLSHLDTLRATAREWREEAVANAAPGVEVAPARVEARWIVEATHVGMGVAGTEIPASTFQSANPIFILTFGLLFTAMWGFLGARGIEPSIPVKFGLGILQLGLGFIALWFAATNPDSRGMVGMSWLLLGYLLHTTGELCVSPVGLSMVTRLSPLRLVSTAMGAWFLASAFAQFLSSIVAQFTGVEHGGGGPKLIPDPVATVGVYGSVFGQIAVFSLITALVVFAMSPFLNKWTHPEADGPSAGRAGH
jgi:dipeptide/tripeptide permease